MRVPILTTCLVGLGFLASHDGALAGIDLLHAPTAVADPIEIDPGDYSPTAATITPAEDPAIASLIAACDREAAHPANDENPAGIEGVLYDRMDGPRALAACLKAANAVPENTRIAYQLARAKQASGQGRGAIAELTALADKGYVPAINNLGATYQIGIGVPRDYGKALLWYERAAELGFVPSMAIVGWLYHQGLGTDEDLKKAFEWYRRASEGGSGSAMHNLGHMYLNGWGVDVDDDLAADWFLRSAENGFGQGMTMAGWIYQVGRGVEMDGKKAIDWYERSAAAGDASGMASLGALYDSGGSGVLRQPDKAASWLVQALAARYPPTRSRLKEQSASLNLDTRRAIQKELIRRGHDLGEPDGVFGTKTMEAIDKVFTAE